MSHCAALDFLARLNGRKFATLLADPPWQFQNRTGKVAPEHRRLSRYATMTLDDIQTLPVRDVTQETAHPYLWVPNALLPEGLAVMQAWGFQYKSNLVWHKIRKDGGRRRAGRGLLISQHHGTGPVRHAWQERPNPGARPQAGEYPQDAKA